MHNINISITERKILESYISVIDSLGTFLGEYCEIILHDLSNLEHSAIHVVNANVTGRKIGAPITNKALEMLSLLEVNNQNHITYFSETNDGKKLRSTTIMIKGVENKVIGLICINWQTNQPMDDFLQLFLNPIENQISQNHNNIKEVYGNDSTILIKSTLDDIVNYDTTVLNSSAKLRVYNIISALDQKGIFQFKEAIPLVSEKLNISKHTVYYTLRKIKKLEKGEDDGNINPVHREKAN